jgi:hypothetical protein
VIDGEIRLQAAKSLGLVSVPCIRVDHLDEVEQRLLRMAVNRLGENGSWDIAELKIEFNELIIIGAPIEISGFDADEIDEIIIGDDNVDEGSRTITRCRPSPSAGWPCGGAIRRYVPARSPSVDVRRWQRS